MLLIHLSFTYNRKLNEQTFRMYIMMKLIHNSLYLNSLSFFNLFVFQAFSCRANKYCTNLQFSVTYNAVVNVNCAKELAFCLLDCKLIISTLASVSFVQNNIFFIFSMFIIPSSASLTFYLSRSCMQSFVNWLYILLANSKLS